MIAKLKGIVDTIAEDYLLLDVQGVCYQVFASNKTLSQLPKKGEAASLLTEMIIRNELPNLFGFLSSYEQSTFQKLVTVQGVGPRLALSILSTLDPDDLALAVYNQDKTRISQADGVGPKLAARLITELKDKLTGPSNTSPSLQAPSSSENSVLSDTLSALENLGYKRSEVSPYLTRALEEHGPQSDVGTLLKTTLTHISRKLTGAA